MREWFRVQRGALWQTERELLLATRRVARLIDEHHNPRWEPTEGTPVGNFIRYGNPWALEHAAYELDATVRHYRFLQRRLM